MHSYTRARHLCSTVLLSFALFHVECVSATGSRTNEDAVCRWPSIGSPATPDDAVPSELDQNNGLDEPDTVSTLQKRAEGNLTRRPQTPTLTWDESVARGRDIWNQLQVVLRTPESQMLPAPCLDIEARWRVIENPALHSDEIAPSWFDILPYASVVGQGVTVPGANPAWYSSRIANPISRPTKFWYTNQYSCAYKAIVAVSLFGQQESLDLRTGQTVVTSAPDRWADVTWSYWNTICQNTNTDPSSLTWLMQERVANDRTKAVMEPLLANAQTVRLRPNMRIPNLKARTLTPSDGDPFFALLKTPNVVGTVHMLMQYVQSLKHKTIAAITVMYVQNYVEYFGSYFLATELGPYQPEHPAATIDTER